MKKEFLKNIYRPSNGLYDSILNRISNEKHILEIKKRLIISSLVFGLSMICFIASIIFFLMASYESGFSQIFSLIFSDFHIISTYSTNFILSLLESLPIYNIIIFLFMVIVVSSVAKFMTKDIKNLIFYTHIKY